MRASRPSRTAPDLVPAIRDGDLWMGKHSDGESSGATRPVVTSMPAMTPARADEIAVRIPLPPFSIQGTLTLPEQPRGIVLLAQGSGASRLGRRDRLILEVLAEARLGTAVLDLITPEEGEVDENTHLLWSDVHFLAGRLVIATDWLAQRAKTRHLSFGHLGAGAGASIALVAASARSSVVQAIVSRGGRPDLVPPALACVTAPTLFIVAGKATKELSANRRAMESLAAMDKKLRIVRRATRPSGTRAALDEMAQLARDWFVRFLDPAGHRLESPANGDVRTQS